MKKKNANNYNNTYIDPHIYLNFDGMWMDGYKYVITNQVLLFVLNFQGIWIGEKKIFLMNFAISITKA